MKRWGCHIALVLLAAWTGCVDKVEFKPDKPSSLPLVIDGTVSAGDTARVSISTGYPADGKYYTKPINNAEVWISSPDEPGQVTYLFSSGGQSYGTLYKSTDVVDIAEGFRYQLHVYYGQVEYVSSPQLVTEPGKIDSIYFEFVSGFNRDRNVPEDGFNVYVDAKLPSTDDWYLRWKVSGTYKIRTEVNPETCISCPTICWISEREDKFLLARSEFVAGTTLRRTFVKYIPISIHTFNDRYHVEVVQQSITSEAWRFYDALRHQLDNASSLFQPAISSPVGNMIPFGSGPHRPVLGIFTASQTVKRGIYIKASDVPYKVRGTFHFGPCTNLPNSSLYPPPFWN